MTPLEGPARTAALDQERAALDETVDEFIADIQTVSDGVDQGEMLLALMESFDTMRAENLALLCAGALLRLAAQP